VKRQGAFASAAWRGRAARRAGRPEARERGGALQRKLKEFPTVADLLALAMTAR